MKSTMNISMAAALALVIAGCCEDHEHDDGGQHGDGGQHDIGGRQHDGGQHDNVSQEPDGGYKMNQMACEHIKKGPFVDLTASASARPGPQWMKSDNRAYRVALSAGKVGYVRFAAANKGDHLFFFDKNIKVAFQDDMGKAISINKTVTSVAACAEVKARHTVDIPVVSLYFLKLGPETMNTNVTVVMGMTEHPH